MNITHLEDPDLDAMLRTADPVDTARLTRAAHSPAASALRETITDDTVSAIRPRRRRFVLMGAVAAVAAAAAIGTAVVAPSSHTTSAYAASAVKFAQESPRLLVTAPGWRVSDVQEDGRYGGEQHFARGDDELGLFWVPGATSKDSDRDGLTPDGHAEIDGHRAWIGYYKIEPVKPTPGVTVDGDGSPASGFDYEAIWSEGDQARELRGVFDSRDEFLQAAQSVRRVDVQTWLDAMPAYVVKPDARRAAIDQMLADIPRPTGFDPTGLYDDPNLKDRYQLGADATGAVTCGWVQQWTSGDAAAKSQASAAMATWPQWKILREMDTEGAFSQGIGEIAAYMNGQDGMVRKSGMTLQQWAGGAVGCHS